MSTTRTPLQAKAHNENNIVETLSNPLIPKECTKNNIRNPFRSNALQGKRFSSLNTKSVLQKENADNQTIDRPVRKGSALTIHRNTKPIKTIAQKKQAFTVFKDKSTSTRPTTCSKSVYALTKQSNQDTFGDLFYTNDTPVAALSNDCLLAIFELCSDLENFCTLLSVCRRWRALASQPFLWKSLTSEWSDFNKRISLLHKPNRTFHQLHYIQKLTITDNNRAVTRSPALDLIKTSPLVHLKELNLTHMNIVDIVYLASWLPNITVLRCKNTHIAKRKNFSLAIFSRLKQLEILEIHFEYPCALSHYHIILGSNSSVHPRQLPKTIQTLSLNNIYDAEEYLDSRRYRVYYDTAVNSLDTEDHDRVINDWLDLEHPIIMKYRMLTSLSNLRSLTLGRVSSFTARVWRECLIPCGSNLEYLSMKHWKGLGIRESPQSITSRQLRQDDALMYDVEAALSEFISSLKNIKTIQLDDFQCGPGLVQGVTKLDKKYAINLASKHDEHDKMSHYQDKLLDNCLISFI